MKTYRTSITALLLVLLVAVAGRAQVRINEISTDANDYVEIINHSTSTANIGGWTLQMTDDPSSVTNFTFPANTMLAPGEIVVVAESSSVPVLPPGVQRFSVGNILWVVNSGGACALNDANDVGQDLLLFGNPTQLPTGSPLSPFSGSAPAGGGSNSEDVFQRNSDTDTDSDADWTMSASGTGTPGQLNPGQMGIQGPPTANFTASSTLATPGGSIQFQDASIGIPTSWSWDLDGDGIVDSTSQNPSFTYTTAGTYDVSLTVTNSFGSDTLVRTAYIQVLVPPTMPFLDDFNNGSPNPYWSFSSTGNGLIQVGSLAPFSPGSGGDALQFTATSGGSLYLNQATLVIDLSGVTDVIVKYWARETSDEYNANDGLFVSDGTTTILAVSHQNLTSAWQEIELDLGAFAGANGLTLTSSFQLIFSQEDNYPIPTDGLIIDDVRIEPPPVPDVGQANQPLASLVIAGAANINGNSAVIGENGPFFLTSAQLDMTITGEPSKPWILMAGPLNRNNHVFVPQGSLDIGFMGNVGDFSDIFVIVNGLNPVTLFDTLAITNAAGTGGMSINVDNLPPGLLTTMQALVYQTNAPFVELTAAFEITIP